MVAAHQGDIFGRQDAGFGDDKLVVGNLFQHCQSGLQADVESAQVAVIDADHGVGDLQSTFQLCLVMYLDEHIHAQIHGQYIQ